MKTDGGPAFPRGKDSWGVVNDGMSLRDYFAAKALTYCLHEFGGNAEDQTQYAQAAYQIADAMLAAREKGNQ